MITHLKNWYLRLVHRGISWYEIKLGSIHIPDTNVEKFVYSLRDFPKIALVKQDVCPDLYCCPPYSSHEEIIFSTLLRNGPLTLITKLYADFWIVKTENTPECQIWREKCFTIQGNQFVEIDEFLNLQTNLPKENINNIQIPQGQYSVRCADIDWGKYDIVISIDIAIPTAITRTYPQIVWCYCLMEPFMKSHKTSTQKLIDGYDLFLNQRSRNIRLFPKPGYHEIDFPYSLQYYGCYHELLQIPLTGERRGVFIEKHTARVLSKEQFRILEKYGPVYLQEGSTKDMLRNLIKSKYFVRLGGNVGLRWANSIIESVSAGCLFFGNPNEFVNKSLFSPNSTVFTFEELIARLDSFEKNKFKYEQERRIQQKLVDYLCFERPLKELFEKSEKIRKKKLQEYKSVTNK